jgi:hypothetical protein
MNEKMKAEQYLKYLDRILAGEKELGVIEDRDVGELLQFAKKLITVDFSVKSKIRDHLRHQLINILSSMDKSVQNMTSDNLLEDEDELLEEELSLAAAGSPESGWKGSCSFYTDCPFKNCTIDCVFRKRN